MDERGNTAKKTGGKTSGVKRARSSRPVPVERNGTRDAARAVRHGPRNELIQAEWLSGRDPRSLAAEHGLKPRRVYEIIRDCREGMVAELNVVSQGKPVLSSRTSCCRRSGRSTTLERSSSVRARKGTRL